LKKAYAHKYNDDIFCISWFLNLFILTSFNSSFPSFFFNRFQLLCQAVDEPGFSVAYARMCDVLQKKQVSFKQSKPNRFIRSKNLKVDHTRLKEIFTFSIFLQVTTDVNGAKQPVNFRKLLVTRCQREFERDYLHGLDKAKYEADLLEAGNDEAKKKTVQVKCH
jgi:hypothetical protein